MVKERSKNKQLVINMAATFVTFLVGLGIRFGLTPYIVRTLGPEAYGFVGLATNILGYTSLITIALNSMAGRFITLRYTSGDIEGANKYFSSVFYSNLILSVVILLLSVGCVIWLEYMINIPERLLFDVKFLFSLLAFNNIIGLLTNTWCVATFIKNRLDLSNVRTIIGNLINATILILLFSCFAPHIWYIGLAGTIMTVYYTTTNFKLASILTPELIIRRANFEWEKVWELVKSGMWNLVSKLGEILSQGLDLVIANICIGTVAMGYFALTRNVPFLILSLFASISSVFSPVLTNLYAEKKRDEMIHEFNKSIRILCFFVALPLACLYVYGDSFYALWLPTEDTHKLQLLTILGTFALPFTLPLESLWNIFTITNKLKYSTLFMLANNILVFSIVAASMLFVKSLEVRLLILACTRSSLGILRGLFFLPMYGAYCLGLPKRTFYKTVIMSIVCQVVSIATCSVTRLFLKAETWSELILAGIIVTLLCVCISSIIILTKHDRQLILSKVLRRKIA